MNKAAHWERRLTIQGTEQPNKLCEKSLFFGGGDFFLPMAAHKNLNKKSLKWLILKKKKETLILKEKYFEKFNILRKNLKIF